jgi:NhaP-type Na+/H+ or K+/H+ antiporter
MLAQHAAKKRVRAISHTDTTYTYCMQILTHILRTYSSYTYCIHVQVMLKAIWGLLIYISDTLIFLVAGLIIVKKAFLTQQIDQHVTLSDWGWMFFLFLMTLVLRGVMIAVSALYLRKKGFGLEPTTCSFDHFCKKMYILVWGGLRGAVALVLALR